MFLKGDHVAGGLTEHNARWFGVAVLAAGLALAPAGVKAQPALGMQSIAAPPDAGAIPLGTGVLTNMPAESWFAYRGVRSVRNVSRATLTPVLPAAGSATGAAAIVLPGGAFRTLSMDLEGWRVAHWLADHGVAAFVLKYRLVPTPPDLRTFKAQMDAILAHGANHLDLTQPPQSLEDARAALRLVRTRAGEWDIDPQRVGVLGFSAGAITALNLTLTAPPTEAPAFLGLIYGPMTPVRVPPDAPPIFAALAADDPLFGHQGFGVIESWQSAGKPVELHFYEHGGHGFGLGVPGTTTTEWSASFIEWLQTNSFIPARNPAGEASRK